MENVILKYQRSFNTVLEELRENENVDCVIVLGSMISGDIWEESDIDLIVIMKNQEKDIDNIYSTINDVPIQIKFISRQFFFEGDNKDILNKIRESKVMLCRDESILSFIRTKRYVEEKNTDIENLIYLGIVVKDIDVVKKYIHNNSIYIAYSVAVRCAENLCNLYLSLNKYTVSNESIKLAMSLDDDIRKNIDSLFFSKGDREKVIKKFVQFVDDFIGDNIAVETSYLLSLFKDGQNMSSQQIKDMDIFKQHKIKIEDILDLMYKKGFIRKSQGIHNDSSGNKLLSQNVYHL